jgi:cytochrome c biogenesis protein CcdA
MEITVWFLGSVFIAGFLMFLAPCTLPLVPGFLALISGDTESRSRLFYNTLLFCTGFSFIFILLGLSVGMVGQFFVSAVGIVTYVSGVVIILMALMLLGVIGQNIFVGNRSFRLPRSIIPGTYRSSFLLGTLFSLGWSPCIGPIMATVLLLAASEGSAGVGFVMLAVFSLGLSVPFLLSALFYAVLKERFVRYQRIGETARVLAGVLLLGFGCLLLLGMEGLILEIGTRLFYAIGLDSLFNYY